MSACGKTGVIYGAGEGFVLSPEQHFMNDNSDGGCNSKVIHSTVQVETQL